LLAAAIVALVVVVAIGTIFNEGDNADQPIRGYDAGPAAAFQPASVNFVEAEHLFIVRLLDGSFLALYDMSSRQQELGGDCRILHDDSAGIGTLSPLPGLAGAFVEDCSGTRAVWRPDGVFSFGNNYGDMDRFGARVTPQGELIIDVSNRSCTRSRGVIGLEPFDVRQDCGPARTEQCVWTHGGTLRAGQVRSRMAAIGPRPRAAHATRGRVGQSAVMGLPCRIPCRSSAIVLFPLKERVPIEDSLRERRAGEGLPGRESRIQAGF
jgi:hypothetical protein